MSYAARKYLIMKKNSSQIICILLLTLTALIWGGGFVSQSIGADFVGPFTFLALRSWIASVAMLPVLYLLVFKKTRSEAPEKKTLNAYSLKGGFVCGLFLFSASAVQQMGIAYTTTAKAGFLTAMYVVMVPLLLVFFGKSVEKRIWLCVALTALGLYLLCLKDGLEFQYGDILMIICALLFAIQIMSINHFIKKVEAVLLAWFEFFFTAVFSTVFMLIFESNSIESLKAAAPSILFAGCLSSAVGYTLQVVGQKGLKPTIASIVMSLESVFSALLGWLILGQKLSLRELSGCILIFAAIIISQLSGSQRRLCEQKKPIDRKPVRT